MKARGLPTIPILLHLAPAEKNKKTKKNPKNKHTRRWLACGCQPLPPSVPIFPSAGLIHIQRGSRSATLRRDEQSITSAPLCSSWLLSLSLAGAVCSAVPVSDRIYPRWAVQLNPLICVWACVCTLDWMSVCISASPFNASSHCPPDDHLKTRPDQRGDTHCHTGDKQHSWARR